VINIAGLHYFAAAIGDVGMLPCILWRQCQEVVRSSGQPDIRETQ